MNDATPLDARWICKTCGWIYDPEKGDPDSGIAPGTEFEDIPDDWYCPLCGVGKSDFILLSEYAAARQAAAPVRTRRARGQVGGDDAIVVVGSGYAGWTLVEQLRERDSERPITLITADDGCYYPKPTLSMAIGQGRCADDLVEFTGAAMAEKLGVTLQANTRVLGIKAQRKKLMTGKGNIAYGDLVLALGASQIRLAMDGDGADEVLRVNDLASYRRLRATLDNGPRRVLVIGAGLLGVEFAEDMASAGHQPVLVDLGTQLLGRLAPEPLANRLQQNFREQGITFYGGTSVSSVEKQGDAYRVTLLNGKEIECDLVMSAVGLAPSVALAKKAGLTTNRGILADRHTMQTCDEHIYALGDCAELMGRTYFYLEPIRRQAETLAAALCGDSKPFEFLPNNIRVKTRGLAINVCPPDLMQSGQGAWHLVEEDGDNCRMEYRVAGKIAGYALSGSYTKEAAGLQRSLIDSLPDVAVA